MAHRHMEQGNLDTRVTLLNNAATLANNIAFHHLYTCHKLSPSAQIKYTKTLQLKFWTTVPNW